MGGLFDFIQHSGIDVVKSSVKRPLEAGKDLIHGKPGAAFQDLRHIVSDNEKAQSKGLGDVGVRGWVGKHPLESAAAVVATIFGGWAAWGAYGGSAAGGAAGTAGATTAGTAGTTAGTTAGATSAMAYTPTASSAFLGGSSATAGSTAGFGSSAAMTYAPTASSAMVGSTAPTTAGLGISGSGVTAFPEVATYSQGTLGSGSGWLGSDAPMIESGAGSSSPSTQNKPEDNKSDSKNKKNPIEAQAPIQSPVTQVKAGEPQNNTALEAPQIQFSQPKFYNSWDDYSSFGGQF